MRALKLQSLIITILFLAVTALSGCSSGKNGDKTAAAPPLAAATVTAGILKLGTAGAPNLIGGIDLTVDLPAGVSVEADPKTGEAATGVVTSLGTASGGNLTVAKYAPASGGTPARLHIIVISAGGFPVGEFAAVRFDLAGGAGLPASDAFALTGFSAISPDGSKLGGVSAAPVSVDAVGNPAAKNKAQLVVTGDLNFLNISVDTPTKNYSQTITGTLFPGDLLVISTNTTATVSAPTITGGAWSAQVSGLVEGPNIIAVTETDAIGAYVASVSATIYLDKQSPNLTIDAIFGTKNSFKAIGGTVDDSPLQIVEVQVNCNTATADMAVVAVPFWSAMIHDLSYGDNHCTVTATDAAGNHVTKDAHIYYDNISPSLDIHVNAQAKFNSIQYVYGTVESGVTPAVTANTLAVVSAVTVTGSNWSTYISGLQKGDNIITVTAADSYGNIVTKTAVITVFDCNGSFTGAQQPTVSDALKALRIAVGLDLEKPEDRFHADVFADDHIDLADAILILEKVAGLIENFPNIDNLINEILQ
jgi:hypothetical protein